MNERGEVINLDQINLLGQCGDGFPHLQHFGQPCPYPKPPEGRRRCVGLDLARIRVMNPDVADVRVAVIRQWELIADAIELIELSEASRCTGWTNREVLAHLYVQPHLVARFLRSESADAAVLGITENLSGTRSFSEMIDASAREGASMNKVELRGPLDAVRRLVLVADLDATITTLQGSISVSDYLVTRCVEAVVHGSDLVPSVSPDPSAQAITSKALLETLSASAPELVAEAAALPVERWIDLATGRSRAMGRLADVLPVMV
jgi:hypothetical protein